MATEAERSQEFAQAAAPREPSDFVRRRLERLQHQSEIIYVPQSAVDTLYALQVGEYLEDGPQPEDFDDPRFQEEALHLHAIFVDSDRWHEEVRAAQGFLGGTIAFGDTQIKRRDLISGGIESVLGAAYRTFSDYDRLTPMTPVVRAVADLHEYSQGHAPGLAEAHLSARNTVMLAALFRPHLRHLMHEIFQERQRNMRRSA